MLRFLERLFGGTARPGIAQIRPEHRALLSNSGLFDGAFYLANHPEVAKRGWDPLDHYIAHGWRERRSPSAAFDVRWYLREYIDVAESNLEPVFHYISYGAAEGRRMSASSAPGAMVEIAEGVDRGPPAPTLQSLREDKFNDMVATAAPGLSILEVGGSELDAMKRILLCLDAGARNARFLSPVRAPASDKAFHHLAARMDVAPEVRSRIETFQKTKSTLKARHFWAEEDLLAQWAVLGELGEPDIANKAGDVDAVVLRDHIFLLREPVQALRRAAGIAKRYVFFNVPITKSFDRQIGDERVSFSAQDMIYAGGRNAPMAKALYESWDDRGVRLAQFAGAGELTPERASEEGLQGVWWWFFGFGGVEKMLAMSGLEIDDFCYSWGDRFLCVRARKRA